MKEKDERRREKTNEDVLVELFSIESKVPVGDVEHAHDGRVVSTIHRGPVF